MNRENLLNALMYVFENYLEEDTVIEPESTEITNEMLKAGFAKKEIAKALGWFDELNHIKNNVAINNILSPSATRILTDYEANKLTLEARGYLSFLEQANIIDAASRELIIDRVMALEEPIIDTAEIKWVALMVLFSQTNKRDQLQLMEELILVHENSTPH